MTIKKRFLARLLCACFAGMLLFGSFRYYAYADTTEIEESIKQKQKEIEEAQKKKKELQSQIPNPYSQKKELLSVP